MTQEKRIEFLIAYLKEENPNWEQQCNLGLCQNQWDIFCSLVCIRPPMPISSQFLAIQDQYLQERCKRNGVQSIEAIPASTANNRLSVWRGDITTLAADAIVNAANSALLGCWLPLHRCIDNVIHCAAGVQLRLACNDIMQQQGHDEPTGKAKITKGYNLPAKFVLHTVGPIITGTVRPKDQELLACCYTSCLELAKKNKIESIAFCCISTGEFRFPKKQAAKIAVEAASKALENEEFPRRVVFNVFNQEDHDIYRTLLG